MFVRGQPQLSSFLKRYERQFNACTEQLCAGTLDGKFPFKIEMPTKWNGTLLLYSHEYRPNVPLPGGKLAGADPVLSPGGRSARQRSVRICSTLVLPWLARPPRSGLAGR